ncbi:CDP-alcohol phosphatidyltransferase family protein [Chengkuizengella axinellae]|uniref:CDP-alcohol phosphatidyltransferase family protein n=1 Tax=Chengkuizengella axinellae TaxID=3064388 RepID=A0ABT9J2G7_9BACL|nr:CDP-alcohol phosphatidyltransferase family protein [Chengkuizengella sp. 2205SS18-9]MDP5275798.1 CDP-alcohol phosphatidyltransferase family protein [Chengkuizengella sp. 2205SS18-9]
MLDTHARHVVQPFIKRTAQLLLNLGLTANQVTWIAFLIGVSTGVFIYFEFMVTAVILLWVSGFLDAIDGSMAREQKKTTAWGTVMDITFDRIVELSVIIGLAVAFPEAQFVLLLLTASIVFSMTVFLTVGALSEKKGIKSFYYQAGLAERTEGFILFSMMIILNHWLIWITVLFFIVEMFTAMQRLLEASKILKE